MSKAASSSRRWTETSSLAAGRLRKTTSVSKKIKQILLRKKKLFVFEKKNSFAKIEKEIPRKYFFSKPEFNGN